MANLTISLDDDLLRKARIRTLAQGTSVNVVLREYLKICAGVRLVREERIKDLLDLSAAAPSRRGSRSWIREELYEQ